LIDEDILDYGNPVYTPGGNAPILPDAITAFGKWAANATSHFKGKNIVSPLAPSSPLSYILFDGFNFPPY
jgi:hypothetical protein